MNGRQKIRYRKRKAHLLVVQLIEDAISAAEFDENWSHQEKLLFESELQLIRHRLLDRADELA